MQRLLGWSVGPRRRGAVDPETRINRGPADFPCGDCQISSYWGDTNNSRALSAKPACYLTTFINFATAISLPHNPGSRYQRHFSLPRERTDPTRGTQHPFQTGISAMEEIPSLPGSPGLGAHVALQPVSPERVNQLRDSPSGSPTRPSSRDSSIHEKIQQFNNMARVTPNTAATMTKQLERKTADAALKRAMLGREEAESEMRRYREDTRILRRQVEEGKERERRVGERLETVMVCLSAHAHFAPSSPPLFLRVSVISNKEPTPAQRPRSDGT
jgi:hypothetical protein